jgi:hypothetical protein
MSDNNGDRTVPAASTRELGAGNGEVVTIATVAGDRSVDDPPQGSCFELDACQCLKLCEQ